MTFGFKGSWVMQVFLDQYQFILPPSSFVHSLFWIVTFSLAIVYRNIVTLHNCHTGMDCMVSVFAVTTSCGSM